MTREEIMQLSQEEVEQRRAAIALETDAADADALDALNAELEALEERSAAILLEAEEARKAAEAVASGAGKPIERREGEKTMTNMEIRNSKEYIEAFAKYIKTGKDTECRALLTENATNGTVPVPELVETRVRTAWQNDEIISRITKTYVRGNLKVGFEISATPAAIHTEGTAAPAEETLTLGIVNMVPQTIKKWITFSSEVMALGAEEFLAYIYDELTYQIIRFAAAVVVSVIGTAPDESTAVAVGVPKVSGDVTPANILKAAAQLSDQAQNRVFIADGETIANVRIAALGAAYAYDPFFGMTVIQNDAMDGSAIVGDLSGVQANLPEGENVRFVLDEYSLAEKDMIKLVGRLYAAVAVVQPGMFALIEPSGN